MSVRSFIQEDRALARIGTDFHFGDGFTPVAGYDDIGDRIGLTFLATVLPLRHDKIAQEHAFQHVHCSLFHDSDCHRHIL
jgi:hypothetical protein